MAADAPAFEALWIADGAGAHRIALADGRVTLATPEAGGARAVAVDPARSVAWVGTGRSLVALGFDGTRSIALPLDLPATVHASLALRSDDGSLWLAAGQDLRGFSSTGTALASKRLSAPAVGLALDASSGLLWVVTAKSVEALDEVSGAHVRLLDLGTSPDVRGLAVTADGNLWVALRDEARLVAADGTLLHTVPGAGLTALAAAPDGGAWLAGSPGRAGGF